MRPDYRLLDRAAVKSAMKEFDRLNLTGVKRIYGFDDSKRYYVFDAARPSRKYPPKAILGIAFKFSPAKKSLKWNEFFGGESDTNRPLKRLGFEIGEKSIQGYSLADLNSFPDRNLDTIIPVSLRLRRGQQAFRKKLLRIYGNRCAITGCKVAALLEAAHVKTYADDGAYAAKNGLILRSDLHTLFDVGLLSIDPVTWSVHIDAAVMDKEYRKLNGRKVFVPSDRRHRLSRKALKKRSAPN